MDSVSELTRSENIRKYGKYHAYYFTPSDFAHRCLLYRLSTGHYYPDAGFSVDRKRFDSYLLMYVADGQLFCQSAGIDCTLNPGEAVMINCYSPHVYKAVVEGEFYWMQFDGNSAARIFSNLSPQNTACLFSGENADKIGQYLIASYTDTHGHSVKETDFSAQLYTLLMSILPSEAESKRKYEQTISNLVASIDYFIQENYREHITLQDITRYAAISESQLIKEYKKQTGITPYAALVKYRLSVACRLLHTTNLSVSEIAENCGYHSIANFTYSFSREMGMSPTDYRANHNAD